MAEYLHGAFAKLASISAKKAADVDSAFVYIGTAPVHQALGVKDNVNVPRIVNSMSEAKAIFGYSDDWAKYTLCEAMYTHLEHEGVAPIVLINVFDPDAMKSAQSVSASMTPENGRIVLLNAEDIIGATVKVGTKVLGTDYTLEYNSAKQSLTISEVTPGSLGTSAINITYNTADPSKVTNATVIGTTDNAGSNTGIYAVRNVYQLCKRVPAFIACPGFSGIPAVHNAMYANSQKINGHWDAYMLCDIPLVDAESNAVTLANAAAWKASNGYTHENESVYFPMVTGVDGKHYHISTLAGAALQRLLLEQDGVPYMSASNTDCDIIETLWLGEEQSGKVFDDEMINRMLNQNGICSATYVGGRWALWGCHPAAYTIATANDQNRFDTAMMMLFYVSNDFQVRRALDVDKPLSMNDLESIVAEEQTRLDALTKIGALTYGKVKLNATYDAKSDAANGDYSFAFEITTTPLVKSLTAYVSWTAEGFTTWYGDFE